MALIAKIVITDTNYNSLTSTLAIMLLLTFIMKAALFPLFFWLPASYHTPSFSTSALFAGLLTKLGIYAIIRMLTLVFIPQQHLLTNLLMIVAICSMIFGILGAIAQTELRRILSFTLISHLGFISIGIALLSSVSFTASLFYMIQHVILKLNLFLTSGIILRITSENEINSISGLYEKYPYLAISFFIAILALVGFPPLASFWAKLLILKELVYLHHFIILLAVLLTSFLSLFLVIRIWNIIFLGKQIDRNYNNNYRKIKNKCALYLPLIILNILMFSLSFMPNYYLQITQKAVDELAQPEKYINLVLHQYEKV